MAYSILRFHSSASGWCKTVNLWSPENTKFSDVKMCRSFFLIQDTYWHAERGWGKRYFNTSSDLGEWTLCNKLPSDIDLMIETVRRDLASQLIIDCDTVKGNSQWCRRRWMPEICYFRTSRLSSHILGGKSLAWALCTNDTDLLQKHARYSHSEQKKHLKKDIFLWLPLCSLGEIIYERFFS